MSNPLVPLSDDDKLDLAARVVGPITEHEQANKPAALVDAGCQYGQRRQAGLSHAVAVNDVERTVAKWYGLPEPPPIAIAKPERPPLAGRLRVEHGRFRNDRGWLTWHGISEFSFIHLMRTGREDELIRRRDRAVAVGGRNVFRIFMRAVNLFDLHHRQPGYWEAVDRVLSLNSEVGAYTELVVYCDAKDMPHAERRAYLDEALSRFAARPEVVWQLSNEPWQNGFSGTDDPQLLELAELLAARLGHRDFSIGDPRDGDDPDASKETIEAAKRLARRCNIIPLHSSRMGGANPQPTRLRRHVDHLEGFYDVLAACRSVNPNIAGVHDEPMGYASRQHVPLPNGRTYEREYDPEVALMAAATAQFAGTGYTYHYVSEQDDGTPGLDLIGQVLVGIPADPSWSYRNDSWDGSATRGFTWQGGKVRTWTNGHEAYVLGYGLVKGEITWANSFTPDGPPRYDGVRVQLRHAVR